MSRKLNLSLTLRYAIIEAIVFCIPVFIYIRDATYQKTWLLFLGCFFFLIVSVFHTLEDSRKSAGRERTFTLVFNSHMITIAAIILSCVLSFILLAIMIPGYLGKGTADTTLADAPPNTIFDKTNGLSFKVFMTAVVGNFIAGSFVGILVPFYSSRRNRRMSGEEFPLKEKRIP